MAPVEEHRPLRLGNFLCPVWGDRIRTQAWRHSPQAKNCKCSRKENGSQAYSFPRGPMLCTTDPWPSGTSLAHFQLLWSHSKGLWPIDIWNFLKEQISTAVGTSHSDGQQAQFYLPPPTPADPIRPGWQKHKVLNGIGESGHLERGTSLPTTTSTPPMA